MDEIKELEQKYLVLKWVDIKDLLSVEERQELNRLVQNVYFGRKDAGKVITPNYLVLNLEDDIDLKYLRNQVLNAIDRPIGSVWRFRVRDIAVDLVNAILRAKKSVAPTHEDSVKREVEA